MFGTDLESAYYQTNNNQNSYNSNSLNNVVKSTPINKPINTTPEQNTSGGPPPINSSSPAPPSIAVYDEPSFPSLTEQQSNNEYLIQQIQAELAKEKQIKPSNQNSIFDRFASKKKDVFKLMNISLSVLLAISLHYVMGDLIKVYLRNNDFTYNKEVFIKSIYPASVLMLLWSLKVFNK